MKPVSFSVALQKHGKLIVTGAWVLSTLLYLYYFGIVTNLEAGKYIEEAHRYIDNGAFSAPRYWFYAVTLFIMIISIKLQVGMTGAFILQALLNLFAYLFFYKALQKLFPGKFIALLVIFYLLAFWPYQSWVVFLFTESAFFSSILIFTAALILYPPDRWKNFILAGTCLLLVIISRPLGILFCGGWYVYLFIHASKKMKLVIAGCSVVLATLAYFTINAVFNSIRDWTITQAFEQESIICDLPAAGPYEKLDLSATGSPVYQLYYYLVHNFNHFIHFAGIKLRYFFLMKRPYYSFTHNLFLLVNLIPLYLLSLIGIFSKANEFGKGIMAFILVTILLYALTIILQCDDYHNRFFLSIYPLLVILAAKGSIHYYRIFFNTTKRLPVSV